MSARDVISRQIEPQAWAALGIGDTIAYRNRRTSSERKADRIIAALTAAGYVILSPDEVRGIRDEAKAEGLEEAADYCWSKRDLLADAEKKHIAAGLTGRDYYGRRLEAELLSRAIRSLKGGRDAQ